MKSLLTFISCNQIKSAQSGIPRLSKERTSILRRDLNIMGNFIIYIYILKIFCLDLSFLKFLKLSHSWGNELDQSNNKTHLFRIAVFRHPGGSTYRRASSTCERTALRSSASPAPRTSVWGRPFGSGRPSGSGRREVARRPARHSGGGVSTAATLNVATRAENVQFYSWFYSIFDVKKNFIILQVIGSRL